ncbi:hypothetical protein B0H13DRAFT_1854408 [Mycena leptocephala]|nr:hypothetical protein B0H13DRAFT_1854408 [Mycena leptocephala]
MFRNYTDSHFLGVGMTQLCNIGTPKGGSYCNDLDGFITTPGTWNEAAVKINLSLPKDMCGDGYTHGAFTTCDGSGNVISVNPPGAGAIKCTKQSEVAKSTGSTYELESGCDYLWPHRLVSFLVGTVRHIGNAMQPIGFEYTLVWQ